MTELAPNTQNFLKSAEEIVGSKGIVMGDDLRGRSVDPLRVMPTLAPVLVRPASTEEVSKVLADCHKRKQRVVFHGGRTGVAGGAYTSADEIVLSLERMTKIEEIDLAAQVAVVQAGCSIEALQNAAAEHGLFYPIDLGSKGTATVGGTISTNAGGNHVLRWGMTRANVLGLEAVLADGTIVSSLNKLVKNNTGYDLKQYFIGSEGTLGVVTRAVVRLIPMPKTQSVAFLAVETIDNVIKLLSAARKLPTLSAFEVLWHDYYKMVAESNTGRRPLPPDWPYYVLVEGRGYHEGIDDQMFEAFLNDAYEQGLIAEAVLAQSERQKKDLWHVREASQVAVQTMYPFVSFDISAELRSMEPCVNECHAAVRKVWPDAKIITFGHLGDNNLHFAIHVGPDTLNLEHEIDQVVYDVVLKYHGALTAEHGVGQLKRDFLKQHKSAAEFDVMRRIKEALDPAGLINHEVMF